MDKKSPAFNSIDNTFSQLKQNPHNKDLVDKIGRLLKAKYNLNFEIYVVANKNKEFFGMSVYPEMSMIDELVSEIIRDGSHNDRESAITKMWATQKNWVIEIDELILTDGRLNASPSELTAVLLHEIGHVVYDNTVPRRALKVMRYEITKMNYKAKQIIRWRRAQRLLDLVVIEACSSKNFSKFSKEELEADKFVVKEGYGDHLYSFIDKLLSVSGNSMIDRTEREIEQDVEQVAQWSLDTLRELEFRKNKLLRMLEVVALRSPSIYVSTLVTKVRADFFSSKSDKNYVAVLQEANLMKEWRKYAVVTEGELIAGGSSSSNCHKGKPTRIKQVDIDMILIQSQKIDTLDDKLYVLDLIQSLQNRLEEQYDMHMVKTTNIPITPKDAINDYLKQLEKLRDVTVKKSVRRSKTFFHKYPKGYEG